MRHLLVDGHNLIGQLPGLKLSDEDDEGELVMLLRRWAQSVRGRTVLVLFDHGVYGHPGRLDGYGVTARFARSPQDADTQLIKIIGTLERPADWTLVSSDQVVIRAAADRKLRVVRSEIFARELAAPPAAARRTPPPAEAQRERHLSQAEIAEWLRLFGEPTDPAE